jgi:hypothetical protein
VARDRSRDEERGMHGEGGGDMREDSGGVDAELAGQIGQCGLKWVDS